MHYLTLFHQIRHNLLLLMHRSFRQDLTLFTNTTLWRNLLTMSTQQENQAFKSFTGTFTTGTVNTLSTVLDFATMARYLEGVSQSLISLGQSASQFGTAFQELSNLLNSMHDQQTKSSE